MARKPKKAPGPGDNSRPTPNEYLAWKGERVRLKMVSKEAAKAVQDHDKRGKALHVNVKAVQAADDPDSLRALVRDADVYYGWENGSPLFTQGDLFAGHDDRPTAKAVEEFTEARADADGYTAGTLGLARDGNPHPAGSALHVAWDAGYLRGMGKIAGEMRENGNSKLADQTRAREPSPHEFGNGSDEERAWP